MKILVSLVVALTLTGCFSKERIIIKPQIVEVPVVVDVAEPPIFPKLTLPIEKITKNTTDKEVVEFYFDTILVMQNEIEKLHNALNVYRKTKEEK